MNDTVRDERISFRATGLLVYLLSLPADWVVSQQHILGLKKEGRDAGITAWRELQESGYIEKIVDRDSGGKITGTTWIIYESDHRLTGKPKTAEPKTAEPFSVNPPLRSKEGIRNKERESTAERELELFEEGETKQDFDKSKLFAEFWKAYPKKKAKDAAQRAFINKQAFRYMPEILAAITQQSKSEQWKKDGGQFIPHPATWLNGGRWQDEADKISGGQKTNGKNNHATLTSSSGNAGTANASAASQY